MALIRDAASTPRSDRADRTPAGRQELSAREALRGANSLPGRRARRARAPGPSRRGGRPDAAREPEPALRHWDDALDRSPRRPREAARRRARRVPVDEVRAAGTRLHHPAPLGRLGQGECRSRSSSAGSALTMMEKSPRARGPALRARERPPPSAARSTIATPRPSPPRRTPRPSCAAGPCIGGTPQYQLWAGPGRPRRLIAERILERAPRSTTIHAIFCARARASATRGPISPSCARSLLGQPTTTRSRSRPASRPEISAAKLERLEDLGYIRPAMPARSERTREPHRRRRARGSVSCASGFATSHGNRSRLERGRARRRSATDITRRPRQRSWAGLRGLLPHLARPLRRRGSQR